MKAVHVADSKALTKQKPHGSPCGFNVLSALGHLSQARHRLNLTIKANCMARRILFDEKRAYGVLDQEGSVYGLDGLRVVDASIMPDLVRAPINPTVLAIGERISDLMRR